MMLDMAIKGYPEGLPFYELWRKLGELEARVQFLENQASLSTLPSPDYDSGWNPISGSQTVTHNLGTVDVLVVFLHSDGSKVRLADANHMVWYIINANVIHLVMPVWAGNYWRLLVWKF